MMRADIYDSILKAAYAAVNSGKTETDIFLSCLCGSTLLFRNSAYKYKL